MLRAVSIGQYSYPGVVSITDYGAVPGGVVDSTDAISAALLAGSGGIVYVPPGTYRVTSGIVVPDYTRLQGASSGASVFSTSAGTGEVLTLGVDSKVEHLKIAASVTRTADAFIRMTGNNGLVSNVELTAYFLGIDVRPTTGTIVGPRLQNIDMYLPATGAGSGGIYINNFSTVQISNLVMANSNTGGPWPDFGIKIRSGDTALFTDMNITQHGIALLIDPQNGESLFGFQVENSLFDESHNAGVNASSVDISPASGGFVWGPLFSNVWFGAADAQGLRLNPSGTVNGLFVTNGRFINNGDSGIRINGSNITNVHVIGGHASGNANAGVNISGGASTVLVQGMLIGPGASGGAQNKGVTIQPGASDYISVIGNTIIGNTSVQLENSGTGTHNIIAGNAGYNPVGASAITVGASPYTYTASASPETIYISGGTVTSVAQGAQTLYAASTNASVSLGPNEAIVVTYSVAPTMKKVVH